MPQKEKESKNQSESMVQQNTKGIIRKKLKKVYKNCKRLLGQSNGLRVDKVCTSDPVKLLFDWSDFVDPAVCRTQLKLLLPL